MAPWNWGQHCTRELLYLNVNSISYKFEEQHVVPDFPCSVSAVQGRNSRGWNEGAAPVADNKCIRVDQT
jgi:hypothetical protein